MTRNEKKEIFLTKIKEIYAEKSDSIIQTISVKRLPTFRVNTLYEDYSFYLDRLRTHYDIKQGPLTGSYVFNGALGELSRTEGVVSGRLYIQGIASMLPPHLLKLATGDNLLDLCASPGSKTSLAAMLTNNTGNITAVENNNNRFHNLRRNLEMLGVRNCRLVKGDAAMIQYNPDFIGQYSKVLVDVPCSNEGNIRLSDPKTMDSWNPRLGKKISQLQKRILSSGIKSLKSGGTAVYSTCTYSVEENEAVVDWALKAFPEVKLKPVEGIVVDLIPGLTEYKKKKFDPSLALTARVLPTKLLDGFFVAVLLKN